MHKIHFFDEIFFGLFCAEISVYLLGENNFCLRMMVISIRVVKFHKKIFWTIFDFRKIAIVWKNRIFVWKTCPDDFFLTIRCAPRARQIIQNFFLNCKSAQVFPKQNIFPLQPKIKELWTCTCGSNGCSLCPWKSFFWFRLHCRERRYLFLCEKIQKLNHTNSGQIPPNKRYLVWVLLIIKQIKSHTRKSFFHVWKINHAKTKFHKSLLKRLVKIAQAKQPTFKVAFKQDNRSYRANINF